MKRKIFSPIFLSIGLSYVFSSGRHRFASVIALLSMLGIMLGVAALIIVVSVMNGLEGDLKERLLSEVPHLVITGSVPRMRTPLWKWSSPGNGSFLKNAAMPGSGKRSFFRKIKNDCFAGNGLSRIRL